MTRLSSLVSAAALLSLFQPLAAQPAPAPDPAPAPLPGHPAPSNTRGAQYPRLNDDGTVTFQVTAPDATSVQLVPRGPGNGLGEKPVAFVRSDKGRWTLTTPVSSGFHYYQIMVDGFQANDPLSRAYSGHNQDTSALEVPDPALDFYALKDVPHGDVRLCRYVSATTGAARTIRVYTPPGYDEHPDRRYPVLYLQHGATESERSWTEQGKADLILDNLIAEGRAVPMLVVMENGYTLPNDHPQAAYARVQRGFPELVVHDLVPFVDARFRTLTDRHHRAIAGLSMGGGQAMLIGLSHLDLFASIGSFSGAVRDFDLATGYNGALSDPAKANGQLDLLWLGCGTEDGLIHTSAGKIHAALTAHGINHVWVEGPGAHVWQVWRGHLHDFAPRLFRDLANAPVAK